MVWIQATAAIRPTRGPCSGASSSTSVASLVCPCLPFMRLPAHRARLISSFCRKDPSRYSRSCWGAISVGRTDRELAFFLTKRLVGLRADRCLLWPRVVSTKSELRAIVGAAIQLVRPRYEWPEADQAAVRKYFTYLRKVLPSAQMAPLASAVESLLAGPGPIDLDGWIAAAEETANRAGLLACGDIMAAAREIVKEARVRRSRPEEAILALVRWSCSSESCDLRSQLGLALVSEEDKTPVVARTYPAY